MRELTAESAKSLTKMIDTKIVTLQSVVQDLNSIRMYLSQFED